MNSFELYQHEVQVDGLSDAFADVEFDPHAQTGSDWYRLMLSAGLGGAVVHGATTTATSETLAKVTEEFARYHASARIKVDRKTKVVKHASADWYEQNLTGHSYYGTTTENKARMLFDTAEWEPATRVRASNAAFVGGLMCAQGSSLDDATKIASVCAGEVVPQEAVINTELPLSVLKREAAAMAKVNHTVYSYANTQRAITWDAHQFHEQTLPADAAMDWSRITTIARYLGEANALLDPKYLAYAENIGVPYSIIRGSWASVHAADYILDSALFQDVTLEAGKVLPTPPLADAYDKQASNMYDAIHRMANEVKTGLSDLTMDNLLRIAETYKARRKPTKRTIAQETEMLADTTMHRYTTEFAANAVASSARAWDSLVTAVTELVQSNRALKAACANAVSAYKGRMEYRDALEPLYLELCDVPVWLRAFDYLKAALGNHYKARERISRLKRSTLANSAPLETPTILTARSRMSLEQPTLKLANLALVGKMPFNRMSIDARRVVAHQNLDRHAALYQSVNSHLHSTKREWAERYKKMAEMYKLAGGQSGMRKSILYGCASKAFSMVNAYLMSKADVGFIDPQELQTSYLVSSATNYVRKRHITKPNFQPLVGLSAVDQATTLDSLLPSPVTFFDCYVFCQGRLVEFYADIHSGVKPILPEEDIAEPDSIQPVTEAQAAQLLAQILELDSQTARSSQATYLQVVSTYQTETQGNRHSEANGYRDLLDAYDGLKDLARFDPEGVFTQKGLDAEYRRAQEDLAERDAPVV